MPLVGFNRIRLHPVATFIKRGEQIFSKVIALLGGSAIPFKSFNGVRRHAFAILVHITKGGLREGTSFFSPFAPEVDRLGILHQKPTPSLEETKHIPEAPWQQGGYNYAGQYADDAYHYNGYAAPTSLALTTCQNKLATEHEAKTQQGSGDQQG